MNILIETTHLQLRPYQGDDLDDLHRLLTDPDVRRYLLDDTIVERDWVADEIEQTISCFKTRGFGQFAVLHKTDNAFIGFCGYRFFFNPPECQLLYALFPTYWGRGLATEAARAMIRYGFETCGFDKILACTDKENVPSQRVLEKAGMNFDRLAIIHGVETVYYALSAVDFNLDETPYRVVFKG